MTVDIDHGPGDAKWAAEEWERERKEADVETVPANEPATSIPSIRRRRKLQPGA